MSSQPAFRIRARIRRWRFWGSLFHLGTLLLAVVALALSLPKSGVLLGGESVRQAELRQELMQYLDRLVRYEHYYRELNGRFTRDLTRLGISATKMAVYLPFSYGFNGQLLIVESNNITELNVSGTEMMKFIISGGVTDI